MNAHILINMRYSLEDFENCIVENILSQEVKDKIEILYSKLGINANDNRRLRRVRSENRGDKNDAWEKAKPVIEFKKTVMKEKTGREKIMSGIKISLNKLNMQNYNKEKEVIFECLKELEESKELEENEQSYMEDILQIFVNTSQMNPFYSKFYVNMLCDIMNIKPELNEIFINSDLVNKYKTSLTEIIYVDSNDDFNKHCLMNKENDKRKGLCIFLIECVKQEVYDEEVLFELFNYIIELLNKNENSKEKVNVNEELIENIFTLLKEGDEVIKKQEYYNSIKSGIKDCKEKKNKEGISKRVIFKLMDICDTF